ncbi:MAG: amidohydrolase family protein, partial [archaeon GB-1867-035]|nr:amidohydrolase family protein [Candidatus Culexmicrobium profundum]
MVSDLDYDLLIVNGRILDGTDNPWFRADVGIANGRIMSIGDLKGIDAELIIDAEGLFVCPGFIDMHSHSDFTLLVNPRAESKVRQGVTTEVIGNCGSSAAPVKGETARARLLSMMHKYGVEFSWSTFSEYLKTLEDRGAAVNVAALVGHGTVRRCVLGLESRPPTRDELDEMKALVAEAMKAGAFGMSSGLVYPPGRYASKEELIELCRVVAKYGGFYASHIRGERETIVEATAEAIEIGERAGVP